MTLTTPQVCKHGSTSCGWCHDMSGALFPEPTSQAEAPEDAEVAEIEKRVAEPIPMSLTNREFTRLLSQAEADRRTLLAKLRARTSQAEAQAPTDSDLAKMVERERARLGWRSGHVTDAEAEYLATIRQEPEEGEAFLLEVMNRSAQAEAQAPTTAAAWVTRMAEHEEANGDADISAGSLKTLARASVLTEDERAHVQKYREFLAIHPANTLGYGKFIAIIDRLTVGAPATAPATWMPIETAPKDGTRFIADMQKYGVHVMRWHAWDDGGMWKTDYQFVPINMIEKAFKGWQPLPAPLFAKGDTP